MKAGSQPLRLQANNYTVNQLTAMASVLARLLRFVQASGGGTRPPPKLEGNTMASIGQNVKVSKNGNTLTIEIDLSAKGQRSASGKSMVIASTRGNAHLEEAGMSLGLNLYKKI